MLPRFHQGRCREPRGTGSVASPARLAYLPVSENSRSADMNRREMLRRTGAALTLGLGGWAGAFPRGWAAAADKAKRRILMYTRSQSYEHDVVKRKNGKLCLAENIGTDLCDQNGFEVNATKDGRLFANDALSKDDLDPCET